MLYSALAIFFAYVCSGFWTAHINISSKFNGVVQKVTYKWFSYRPIITVKNKQYNLEYIRWYGDEEQPKVGDSVVKEKGNDTMSYFKNVKK
ncbi:MAG: hypothetical protein ACXVAY_00115 [Mucilaginibacter sp.]